MFKRNLILTPIVILALCGLSACTMVGAAGAPGLLGPAPNTPAAGAAAAAGPSGAQVAAIEKVIQQGNQEEVQAVVSGNPAVMQDTATASYYQQSAQNVQDLLNSGVKAIQLVSLKWGPITLQNATTAQATTSETWSTTLQDGSTLQATDTNVYTLVLQNGAWKAQDDQHPDTPGLQPPSGNPGGGAGTPPLAPAPAGGSAQSQSRNWSGYAATGGAFTAVSATWTVPKVSAGNSLGSDATWIGIGGVTARDLIQAGTQAVVQGGQVTYSAFWETLPQAAQDVPLDVSAGDSVTVTITQQANGTWLIRISDATNKQTWQHNLAYQSSRSSAEWVEEVPSTGRRTLLPLDNFGQVTFTSASTVENGQTRPIAQAGGQPITLNNAAGQALVQTSVLAADGSGFSVARTSVPAQPLTAGGRRFRGGGNRP